MTIDVGQSPLRSQDGHQRFQISGADLDSDVADLEHLGGMNAGASSAAEFPAHFAEDVRWPHIDIAGAAATANPTGWKTCGMSGFGARLLVDTLERFD